MEQINIGVHDEIWDFILQYRGYSIYQVPSSKQSKWPHPKILFVPVYEIEES